jgi:hypothetical protein
MLLRSDDTYRLMKDEIAQIVGDQLAEVGITPETPNVLTDWPRPACYTFKLTSDQPFGQIAELIDSAFCADVQLYTLVKAPNNVYLASLKVDVNAVRAVEA